jgi:diguanylate cyclase (GGDEF)-like protein
MEGTYNSWLVALSIAVAVLVSYTALKLAARVAAADRAVSQMWLFGGAFSMGIGIWSMHFIGMLAFSLPIPLRYDITTTIASLAIAIVTSGFAIKISSGPQLSLERLGFGGLVMGAGISAMHYTGMAAIQIVPMIRYEPLLVVASIAIAVTASFAALWLAFHLRHGQSAVLVLARVAAAIIMGLAIAGMHYTAMGASAFEPNSYCRGGALLNSEWLALTIGLVAIALLTVTLITEIYDAKLTSRTQLHSHRLEQVNVELNHQATHDALTGLPNRLLFIDRLEQALAQAHRHGSRFAVMVLDLDRFKLINDSLGHGAGDQLLVEVARRLTTAVRKIDTVARVGGDEFLLIVSDLKEADDAAAVAKKIIEAVSQSCHVATVELQTSPSIGISVFPKDGTDAEALLAHADEAMYCAKQRGGNTFQFFAAGMNAFTPGRLQLENDLRRALSLRQFELYYQPKVDVANGRVASVEALIRWHHPVKGMISPDAFIPVAEETGLIIPIGDWVLHEACRQARAWQMSGLRALRVAVNLSATQFRQPNLLATISAALEKNNLLPRFLEVELTESAVMTNAEGSVAILEQLSRMGVVVAIDDFGTGYSSMSYLRRFPIDRLKIDRSFVRDLGADADNTSIVQAIISLAHSLRLKVVAEGVETPEQLEHLRLLGCDQYQGYHHSVPGTAASIEAMIRASDASRPKLMGDDLARTYTKLEPLRPNQAALK